MTYVEDRWERAARRGKGLRWRVRYIAPHGKERSRSYAKKVEATEFAATVSTEVMRGTYVDPKIGRVTIENFAECWLADRIDLRPPTRELYRAHIDNHIVPTLGDKLLGSLRPTEVRAAVQVWSGTLKPATVRTAFAVLTGMLSAAVADGLIAKSPSLGTPLPRVEHRTVAPMSPESVRKVAEKIAPRYRLAVILGAGASLRQGEALELTLTRVDFLRRRIAVEQQLQPAAVGGPGVLSPLKTTASRRVVPVDDVVLEEIARHVELYGTHENGILITNRVGSTVRRSSFGNRWTAAIAAGKLPPARFHDLRHFYASTLIAAGMHPKAIRTRLGHASITETMDIYGPPVPRARGSSPRRARCRPATTV